MLLSILVDVLVGGSLVAGSNRLRALAVIRVVLGGGLIGLSTVLAGDALGLALLGMAAAVLMLLFGDPKRDRRILFAGVFVAAGAFTLSGLRTERKKPNQLLTLELGGEALGAAVPYTIQMPPRWLQDTPRKGWDARLIRTGTGAMVDVKIEATPQGPIVDQLAAEALQPGEQVVQRHRLQKFGDASLVQEVAGEGQTTLMVATVVTRRHVYTLVGIAQRNDYSVVASEMEKMFESLQPPTEEEALPLEAGKVLLGRVGGRTTGYSFDFPDHWHAHRAQAGDEGPWDLWAMRPFRGAMLQVEVFAAPTALDGNASGQRWLRSMREKFERVNVLEESGSATDRSRYSMHIEISDQGHRWFELRRFGRRGIIVHGFAPTASGTELRAEVQRLVASLRFD